MADDTMTATPAPAQPALPLTPAAAPETPAAPHPSESQPRDAKGRFSAEAIAKAAREVMGSEAVPETPTAAAAAPAPAEQTPAPTPETPAAPSAIDAFLAAPLPTEEAAAPAQPAAPVYQTPEAQQAAAWAENPQQAAEAVRAVRALGAVEQAIGRGDIAGLLNQFDPAVAAAIAEHVYQSNRDQWAQRYADEANGVRQDPLVSVLQRQLADMQRRFEQQESQRQTETQRQQQAQQSAAVKAQFSGHLNNLFAQVKLDAHPLKGAMTAQILDAVRSDPAVAAQIRAGRMGGVTAKFRDALQTFKPYLETAPAAAAPAPKETKGAAALMAAPAGQDAGAAPAAPALVGPDKRLTGAGVVSRLKDYVKRNAG